MSVTQWSTRIVFLCMLFTLFGCAALWPDGTVRERHSSSSLVDFLYPDGAVLPESTSVAQLALPLRVGIGFVPGDDYARGQGTALTEESRAELLREVESRFSSLDYVKNIIIIPQTYLRGRNGLLAVEQVGRLHQLDVIGLVSYDQSTVSESRTSSLLYWTILGAYVVKGNTNEVSTFMDLAVLDVSTRKLLLRAGGIHQGQANSTLIDRARVNRGSQLEGFDYATEDLMANFSAELERFESSLHANADVDVVDRSGGGGGALMTELMTLILLIGRLTTARSSGR